MHADAKVFPERRVASLFLAAAILAGCGTTKEVVRDEKFQPGTSYSKVFPGSGQDVCWSVKRALLSQGYMLDNAADSVTLTGTKDFQTDSETTVTLRLQSSCADNRNGTSTVFATASREVRKLQKVKQSVTAGVSIATVTVPWGSERVLQLVSRETVTWGGFYDNFYDLVARYAQDEVESARANTRDRTRESSRESSRESARESSARDGNRESER